MRLFAPADNLKTKSSGGDLSLWGPRKFFGKFFPMETEAYLLHGYVAQIHIMQASRENVICVTWGDNMRGMKSIANGVMNDS